MSVPNGIVITVVRRAQTGVDARNNPIFTWADSHTIEGVAVAPRAEGELTDQGRQGAVIGHTLYLPFGSDFTYHDRCRLGTDNLLDIHEVDGEPGSWKNAFSGIGRGVAVAIRRVEG